MTPVIFTDFRREMIARTLFDLLKIAVAAALASRFFVGFPRVVQLLVGLLMIAALASGVLFCPLKKPGE